jgi:hypothetical protein
MEKTHTDKIVESFKDIVRSQLEAHPGISCEDLRCKLIELSGGELAGDDFFEETYPVVYAMEEMLLGLKRRRQEKEQVTTTKKKRKNRRRRKRRKRTRTCNSDVAAHSRPCGDVPLGQ